jgi:hypothetical protein
MEEIEGKDDCATPIARHKLTIYKKLVYLFTIDHVRDFKFDNKQSASVTY